MSEGKTFRTFSTSFKQAAMQRLEAGEALAALGRELGVARKLLYDWRKAWRAEGASGLNRKRGPKSGPRLAKPPPDPALPGSGQELAQAKAKIAALERLIGRQQSLPRRRPGSISIFFAPPCVPWTGNRSRRPPAAALPGHRSHD